MNTNSTKRKKLYYDFSVPFPEEAASEVIFLLEFCASTGANFGTADADRYGNVMEPNRFAGVATSAAAIQRRCKQAIGGWFQCSQITAGVVGTGEAEAAGQVRIPKACLDFIKAAGNLTQPGIDPSTELRPRARVTFNGSSSGHIRGTLYIQRQHSIEI
jgi:hypothetical protein